MPVFVTTVFTLDAPADSRNAFLMVWSYHRKVSTVGGVLKREGGSCVFRIDVPIARGLAPAIQLGRTRG